jgi:hypothetical protein
VARLCSPADEHVRATASPGRRAPLTGSGSSRATPRDQARRRVGSNRHRRCNFRAVRG